MDLMKKVPLICDGSTPLFSPIILSPIVVLVRLEGLRIERLKTVSKFGRETIKQNPILLTIVDEIVLRMGLMAIKK